jgi:intein-encoded DNA endonuclease-like protein
VGLLLYAGKLLRKYGVESRGPHLGKLAGTVLKDSQTGKLYRRKKNCYHSYLRVRSLPQFAEQIGFTIERKQRRLRVACS